MHFINNDGVLCLTGVKVLDRNPYLSLHSNINFDSPMKRFLLPVLMFLNISLFAQTDMHCATDELMKKIYAAHPEKKEQAMQRRLLQKNVNPESIAASYTIPIVFHILHQGGPENISDAQVLDALQILNNDYALQNADTSDIIPSFKSIADSTGIQFVLATIDPNGNCTSGIVHYFDTDADWDESSPTLYSHTWDPTMYLNIYVVKTITLGSGFGAAGYTFFPGSFAPGDPMDAIVVLNNYFGSIGTGSAFQSRVLTHEVGHWLNLAHVFGFNSAGTDCFGDDMINDTPPTPGYLICPDSNDPPSYQICTPGVDENFQNYMDYSYCNRMFTHDQGEAMRAALNDPIAGRDNLWTPANLLATGVTNPSSACIPVADFKYDRSVTCVGAPVQFSDASWNGQPTVYNWTFPSGNPASSTSPNPVVTYTSTGVYSASLTTSNAAGISSPITKTNIITVTNNTAMYNTTWFDGFEVSTLPGNDWAIQNSSGGTNWEQSFDAAYNGTFSAKLPAVSNTRKAVTSMISPSINLQSFTNPELSFYLAATELNQAHINNLKVYISTDCEVTWNEIYNKTGAALITTIDSITPFIPFSANQWRNETVSLSSYASAPSAKLKFSYTRDTLPTPSNVFIDNINITSVVDVNQINNYGSINVFPNPAEDIIQLDLKVSETCNTTISLVDVTGRAIFTEVKNSISPGNYHFTIGDDFKLQPGIYLVTVKMNDYTTSQKVVVK